MGDSKSSSQDLCVLFAWGYAWLHPLKAVAFVRATFVVCRVPCALCLVRPSCHPACHIALSSVVCHPPWPPGCQLCLIASAAAATLCSANKLHFDFRFPLATCRTALHRSPAASCHMPQGTLRGRRSALCKCLSPLESLEIRPGKCAQAQK